MIIRSFAIAALTLAAAAPALAHEDVKHSAVYDPARCTIQTVHVPAGKIVHNPHIIRCRTVAPAAELAKHDAAPTPASLRTAQD